MENERLKIFDEHRTEIGAATRGDIHKIGYWHETFHCWLLSKQDDRTYIYFQLRSDSKKDFPNLLDITAAGHLLSHETIHDGIREVEEELGINVAINDLISLGIIKNSIKQVDFIDKEFCHTFLYVANHAMDEFKLQVEEVAGILKTEFDHFGDLWSGKRNEFVPFPQLTSLR